MAATWAGVACFGVAGASRQKPRALMISAGVCGFGSAFSADACLSADAACFGFPGWTICASAEANWKVAATWGFARGVGTGSADLAGAAAADTLAPAGLPFAPVAPPSPPLVGLPFDRRGEYAGVAGGSTHTL